MTQPGSPASAMPADESSVMRRLADLERQMRELGPSIADSFKSTVGYLESLVTRGDSITSFFTGTTPGDATYRWFDSTPSLQVDLAAPTGRVLVTVGCGEASLWPGDSSALARMSFRMDAPSGWSVSETAHRGARLFLQSDTGRLGASMLSQVLVDVPKDEPITFTARFAIWSSSTGSLAEATFSGPYLTVEVIDPL